MFVAVAYAGANGIDAGTGAAAYSADAVEWQSTMLPSAGSWNSVAAGDGKFVAVSDDGQVAYSP